MKASRLGYKTSLAKSNLEFSKNSWTRAYSRDERERRRGHLRAFATHTNEDIWKKLSEFKKEPHSASNKGIEQDATGVSYGVDRERPLRKDRAVPRTVDGLVLEFVLHTEALAESKARAL